MSNDTNTNSINNNWSSDKENILREWGVQSDMHSWLHNYNAEYYSKLDKWLSIPSILISAVTSTALFSSLGLEDDKYIVISFGILLIIGTALQSSRDFINVIHLIHENRNCSKLYQILSNDIDEQLHQSSKEREDGSKFLNKIKIKKNDLYLNAPPINNKTWSLFKNKIKNGNFINFKNPQYVLNYLKFNRCSVADINIGTNDDTNDNTNNDTNDNANYDTNDNTNDTRINIINNTELEELAELDISIEDLKKKLTFI